MTVVLEEGKPIILEKKKQVKKCPYCGAPM